MPILFRIVLVPCFLVIEDRVFEAIGDEFDMLRISRVIDGGIFGESFALPTAGKCILQSGDYFFHRSFVLCQRHHCPLFPVVKCAMRIRVSVSLATPK
jgi:hypothetical protein